ncbi:unnamed protein product [Rhodiola kirilowii]
MVESACRAEWYTSSCMYLMFHSPHNCSKSNLHTGNVIPQAANMDTVEVETKPNEAKSETKERGSSSIEVKVLFFARARDITGVADMSLQVSAGSTACDCLDKVVAKFPSLAEIRECMVVAVNEEYAPGSTVVKHKDELALIPPISGG